MGKSYTKEVRELRQRIEESGLSYPHIYKAVGISAGWFMRMIRGDFIQPNSEWMHLINDYLDDFLILTLKWMAIREGRK